MVPAIRSGSIQGGRRAAPYNELVSRDTRIGYGEDSHRLTRGRRLIVGGTEIDDSPHGSDAHSDGDVLLHALADALLSAYSLGDIGRLFPTDDDSFREMPGREIVREVLGRVRRIAGRVNFHNVAAVVTLDEPKLGAHRKAMEQRIANLLGLEPGRVGVTFKTSEGAAPGFIQARVTLLLSEDRT